MRLTRVLPFMLMLSAAACGKGNPGTHTPPSRERTIIRITEIQEGISNGLTNVYDLVQRDHPEWLRSVQSPLSGSAQAPLVWMDTQRMGDASALRSISLGGVTMIRLLSPSESRVELGANNAAGAILVSSH